ncbi:peptidase M23 [Bacteroidales bacterium]|nr:peptidase M23 [Bacteroidales bacterium]
MAGKARKKSNFWKKMRFKYKLSFLNENTLEEVFSFRMSRLEAFLSIAFFTVLMITLTSIVIINTPIRNYLPGYLETEVRQSMVNNALRADSLTMAMESQMLYMNNLGSILRGDMEIDSVYALQKIDKEDIKSLEKSPETKKILDKYAEEEKYNLTVLSSNASTDIPENTMFFRPVKGIVSSHFDAAERHFGTDIAAAEKSSVLATLKGTVVYAGFDANTGYNIQLQHKNGMISIYKHNAVLLKKIGQEVNAGEVIALVGNTGTLSTGSHLHFELWYKGSPVDPEEFIAF